jgi:protein-disulfide isomerase
MIFNRPLRRLRAPLAAAAALVALAAPALPQVSPAQRAEFETIIRDYLLKHPEVLREALIELQRREKAEEAAARDKVVGDPASPLYVSDNHAVVGNPKGKVTIVEFFDYNCGYCKRALDDLNKLIKTDPEVRVVLKDFPVLGPGSVEAAKVAQAVKRQLKGDKFFDFHQKLLLMRGQIGKGQALAAARDVGVDMDRLAKDLDSPQIVAGIEETIRLGDALSITGTPAYVVGKEVVVGAVGFDRLKTHVANVHKCGVAVC